MKYVECFLRRSRNVAITNNPFFTAIKMLAVIFFFLTTLSVYAGDNGFQFIYRRQIAAAHVHYTQAANCATEVAGENRLTKLAREIRQEPIGENTSFLFNALGLRSNERPTSYAIADSLGETGHSAEALYRAGILPLPGLRTQSELTPEAYRRLYYLLRFNGIPTPALTHPPIDDGQYGPHDYLVDFHNDVLWGIQLTYEEFAFHAAELEAHPTLEHLTIVVAISDFRKLLNSQHLSKYTSLYFQFVDDGELPGSDTFGSEAEIAHFVAQGKFRNLRSLKFHDLQDPNLQRRLVSSQILRPFASATNLTALEFGEIPIDGMPPHRFDRLQSLELQNVIDWTANEGRARTGRLRTELAAQQLRSFLSGIAAGLNKLILRDLQQEGRLDRIAGEVLDVSSLSPLSSLEILASRPLRGQQWDRLANAPFWRTLRNFTYDQQNSLPEGRMRVDEANLALRRAELLARLEIVATIDDNRVTRLFSGIAPQLRELDLHRAAVGDDFANQLAAVEMPNLATLKWMPADAGFVHSAKLASPNFPALREIVHYRFPSRDSRSPDVIQAIADFEASETHLRANGIEVRRGQR